MDPSLYHTFYEVEDRHWWFVGRRAVVDEFLSASLGKPVPGSSPERLILDVGCGTGGMLPLLSRYGKVTGIDSEPLALEYCRKRGLSDVQLQEEFKSHHAFDVVTLFDVLEHVDDEAAFLREMRGHLKPGGRLIITVPAFQFLWSRHDELNLHKRRYTRGRLVRAVEAAGFSVRRVSYFNTILFPLAVASRLFADRRPIEAGKDEAEILKPLRIGALNGFLSAVFGSERFVLRLASMPVGVSLFAETVRMT